MSMTSAHFLAMVASSTGYHQTASESLANVSAVNSTFYYYDEEPQGYSSEIGRMINIIVRPVLIVGGSVGNLTAFFVMRRGSLQKVSTCFYMSILALADTGMLWCGAFVWWVPYLTNWTVNADAWTDCKLSLFLYYFFRHFSSSLLVSMSIEKMFAVYFPLKTKSVCTVHTAKRVSISLAVIFSICNFPLFFAFRANSGVDFDAYDRCTFVPEHLEIVFYRFDFIFYSSAPFSLMIIANTAIVFKFMKAKCHSGGVESTSQALSKSATKGTAMLVTISMAFVVLTGPRSMAFTLTKAPPPIYHAITINMQYVNHSINAVLYCVVGSRFRNELMKTLCCQSKSLGRGPSQMTFSETSIRTVTSQVNSTGV